MLRRSPPDGSYVYDTEIQLYYVSSRYYNPAWGRFLNADILISTGQGLLGNNMFAYCLNNPVCRKDILGATSVEIFDSDGNPLTDDDERFDGGKMGNGNCGGGGNSAPGGQAEGCGGGGSNSSPAQTGSANAPASSGNSSSIPKCAYDTLDYIKDHNGAPPKGYKGGSPFANDGRDGSARLPDCYAPYYEYDVHPKVPGESRGNERIVVGNGAAFYTPNHYRTFLQME